MLELILTMLAALEDYNDLNFTKTDIDNFIKKYNILDEKKDCNERGWILLWKNKYLSDNEFFKLMGIDEYKNGNYYLIFDNFDDILGSKYETEIDFLNGEVDWNPSSWYKVDVETYWRDYTENTLKEIAKYCIDKGLEIDDELMTEENTKIIDGKLFFNNINLKDLIDEDDLEDLRSILNDAICEAQDNAEYSEAYNKIVNNFKNKIGDFERITVEEDGKKIEKIKIKINIDMFDIENALKDWYGDFDFEQANYGDLYQILREMEYFEFDVPDYNYIYASIDDDTLNEITVNKLQWD